jgi:ADP-heptose:LPS heptosyltransferase
LRILLSKINFLGDAVSFSPILKGIAEQLPGVQMTMVCTRVGRQVFEGAIDHLEFYTVEFNRAQSPSFLLELWRAMRKLGKCNFDFSLHSYDEPSFSHILARALRIPRRFGFDSRIAKGQRLLSRRLPFDMSRNVVDLNFDLVRCLTGRWDLRPQRLSIWYSPDDLEYVTDKLLNLGLKISSPFVAIHPGSKLSYREWGSDRFCRLAKRLEDRSGLPALLITEQNNSDFLALRRISGLTVKQLACLLKNACVFVGNNSGPMHVAVAMGTPSVIIQGPTATNWEIFWEEVPHCILKANHLTCLPCENLVTIPGACLNLEAPLACMKDISVDMVEDRVIRLIDHLDI